MAARRLPGACVEGPEPPFSWSGGVWMCATSAKEAERAALDEMDKYHIVTQTEIQVIQLRFPGRAPLWPSAWVAIGTYGVSGDGPQQWSRGPWLCGTSAKKAGA